MVCCVSCCVTLLKKARFTRDRTAVKKWRQNACYVSLWICGLRRSGFSSPTCTHSTPHTNFYSSFSSTPWIITVFLDHCLLFWEFVHPLTWNQASFVVTSSPLYIQWRYRFQKFRYVSHSVKLCSWTTQNHQFCCIFWRWRIHTPVCFGSRVSHCFWEFQRRFLPSLFSVSSCLVRVGLQYEMELVARKFFMLSRIVLLSLELHHRRNLRRQFL